MKRNFTIIGIMVLVAVLAAGIGLNEGVRIGVYAGQKDMIQEMEWCAAVGSGSIQIVKGKMHCVTDGESSQREQNND